MLAANDAREGAPADDRQLRDEIMTMILAGHETTANALTWIWVLLATHPAAGARLAEELSHVVGDAPLTAEAVDKLPYTEALIREALRLFPPAWVFERQAVAADRVGDIDIPAGWLVAISPWLLHRDPQIYPDPEAFRPERFLGGEAPGRYAYLPFGAGPRVCIGGGFALLELKIIVASLASRFHVDVAEPGGIAPRAGITLRPASPVWARAVPRRERSFGSG